MPEPSQPSPPSRWATLSRDEQRSVLNWLVDTVLIHGGALSTGFRVAGEFAADLDRGNKWLESSDA